MVGTLAWDPAVGGELSVAGMFGLGTVADPLSWRGPIIHGAAEGTNFTLIDCHAASFNLSGPGVMIHRLQPYGGVLVGVHLDSPDSSRFDRLVIAIDYLHDLTGLGNVEMSRAPGLRGARDGITLHYETPPDVVAALPGEHCRLAGTWAVGHEKAGRSISPQVRLVVDSRQPQPLAELVERYVLTLRDLVTFLAQQPACIRSVQVSGSATTVAGRDGPVSRPAELLLPFLPQPEPEPPPLKHPLIMIPTDGRSLRSLLGSWFDLADRLAPVIDLRLAATYATFIYGETRFVNVAQAVEALHRRVLDDGPSAEAIEARDAALEACPEEQKKWLGDKLRYAHEPNLRQRLRETLDFVGPALDPLIGRRRLFVHEVVETRNNLTHWDASRPSPDSQRLLMLAIALAFVVDASLLRLLGKSTDEVAEILGSNSMFQWASSRMAAG